MMRGSVDMPVSEPDSVAYDSFYSEPMNESNDFIGIW